MRLTWFTFVASFALIIWTGETTQGFSWLAVSSAGKTIVILAMFYTLSFLFIWRKRYIPALIAVRNQPEDMHAVRRWTSYWTILLCAANSGALFGFAFRVGGKTLQQSLPFYVTGFLLILWLWPRQVWSSSEQPLTR
jgi:hypothetical protein